ncbi:MAG: EAL domain-containing protein [Methylococcaceae bacterium]|nr:EAL domain-containing protein [Methylococcaceae bacterium]
MDLSSIIKLIALNLLIAIIYFLFGAAGLQLGVLSGYSTAIFPAAGVAFVAIFSGGSRLLPAVWLGSASINLWMSSKFGDIGVQSMAVAASIGIASSLQAWIAVVLVNRFCKPDSEKLLSISDSLRFLILAAPIACLIAASWAGATLLTANIILSTELVSHWLYWWLGDTLGVILFTPLLLMALNYRKPWWSQRIKNIVPPILTALMITLLIFFYVTDNEKQHITNQLKETASPIAESIKSKLSAYQELVASIGNLIKVNPSLEYSLFDHFTKSILANHPELSALSWNPRISSSDRPQFEVYISQQMGMPNIRITQRDQLNQLVPAKERSSYVPVAYISPFSLNRKAVGYDISSNPVRLKALDLANTTGKMAVTAPIQLIQGTGMRMGILLVTPVMPDSPSGSPDGYAVGVFHLDTIWQQVFSTQLPEGLSLVLEDINSNTSNTTLFHSAKTTTFQDFEYSSVDNIYFGGRNWRLSIYASPSYLASQQSLLAWQILLAGLVFISLLQLLLLSVTGHHYITVQKVKQLFNEQTAILNNELVAIATVRDRNIIWVNTAMELMLGYDENELNGCPTRQCYAHEEDYQSTGKSYASIQNDGVIHNELEFVCKDGQHIWVDIRGSILHKETNESLWVFVDVTERKLAELTSIAAETKFKALFDSTNDAVMLIGETNFIDGNSAALKLFGCSTVEEFRSKSLADLSPLDQPCGTNSATLANQWIELALQHGKQRFEWVHKRADTNETFQADVLMSAVEINDKSLVQAAVRDISEQKRIEANLRIAATAFESQEGMMVTDADSVIIRVNKAFTTITGYKAEEVIGNKPSILSSERHDACFYDDMWQTINSTDYWEGEIWSKRKNDEIYPEKLTITAVKNSAGIVINYVGTLTDITQSKQAEQEIEDLAYYDPLTHLPNRRLMIDRIWHAMAASERSGNGGALLFLDLDYFKTLNDTLGHDMGDILLQQVAERLTTCVREGDTVSRFGGDEFVVLLEGLSIQAAEAAAQAEDIANKILSSINLPYQLASHHYTSSTSVGITLFNDHQTEVEELLKQADIAMYQAKDDGRNALRFFDPQMQACIAARAELENELNQAIEQQQFQLYYQMHVDSSLCTVGAEVLIRWIHPERGLISPLDFIPIAEQNGAILSIGQWVFDTACAQLKIWQQDALTRELTLSVNVSAKQFHQVDFISQVTMTVQKHNINPARLKLELTESLLLNDVEDTIAKMKALAGIGIQFSLDDFGTGYSSLQYLKQLPLHQLKIDKSFIDDLVSDSNDQAIVRTIIAMAHSLGLSVIAEGVETKEQQQRLLTEGCTHYQGYLFSKPLSIAEFNELLKEQGVS